MNKEAAILAGKQMQIGTRWNINNQEDAQVYPPLLRK